MMLRAVRVRNTELEGSADEVLQGETHNLSQFSVGARCFVTDVMMPPLSSVTRLVTTVSQMSPGNFIAEMSPGCHDAASVYISGLSFCHPASPVTSPPGNCVVTPAVSHQPLPGSHVNHKHQIISKEKSVHRL